MADVSAYGSWVATDDWRAWVGVTKTAETETSVTVQVDAWLCSWYGWSNSASSVQGWAGIKIGSDAWKWSSAVNVGVFSTNQEFSFKKQSWTVTKTHAAQTVTGSSWVEGKALGYNGMKSEAKASITVAAKKSYTVSYNANGGSGAPSSQTKWYGEDLTLSSTKPTRSGYTFQGWGTSASATTVSYAAGAAYKGNAALTLYAIWKANTYTITYNANGGSGAPANQTKTHGTNLTLSSTKPTRTGYTFKNWNTAANGSGTAYNAGASYSANAATTLYAQWTLNTYTVSYNANGGSGAPAAQTKQYGVTLTLSSTKPTRTNYAFQGWATSASGAVAYQAGGNYTANAAVTLYAVWTQQVWTVSYNANGGSGAPSSQTKKLNVALTLSSTKPTRTGYSFQGWGTSSTTSTVSYAPGATYNSNANLALYAVWKANTYTVSFNANGGSGAPGNQTKTYGVTLTLSSTKPTRANYTFAGWATSASATSATYQAGGSYTANAAVTLYAVWTLNYVQPSVTALTAVRCLQDGTEDDEGTYAKVTATWKLGIAITNAGKQATFKVGSVTKTETISGESGTVSAILGTFATNSSFQVSVTVTDTIGGSASRNTILSSSFFTLDFASGGKGIGMGQAAPTTGLQISFDTQITGSLTIKNDSGYARLSTQTQNSSYQVLRAYDAGEYGQNILFGAGGNTLIGGGEYASNRYSLGDITTQENLYLGADNYIYLEPNANVIANRSTFILQSNVLSLRANNVDASKADNGVTSTLYLTTYNIQDSAGRIISRKETIVQTNGNISAYWYVRNYDTSGTQVAQKGIQMTMNKSGTLTYSFADVANARSGLGLALQSATGDAVCTAATNFTMTAANARKASGVVSLNLHITTTNALTANTQYTVGTVATAYCPSMEAALSMKTSNNNLVRCMVQANGTVTIRPNAAIAAGGVIYVSGAYVAASF